MHKYKSYLLLFAVFFLLTACDNKKESQDFCFYYRDHICFSDSFPQYSGYRVSTNNPQIFIEGDNAYLRDLESLNADYLKFDFYFSKGAIIDTVHARIRCWRENGPYLQETTSAKWLKESYVGIKYRNAKKRLLKTGYSSILLTQNDTTYFIENGALCWRSADSKGFLSKQVQLDRSEYNEMLLNKNIGIIRTGNKIYISKDNLKTWSIIHEGSHSLLKSMIWDAEKESVVFSNYTGGDARVRHYIRRYNFNTGVTDTLWTLYTREDYNRSGLTPFGRHIHIIDVDPFTGDWYVGVGDYDGEAGIYRSTDQGKTFEKVGGGEQMWRTLSFIFRKDYIFWTADSESPQYISRISRNQLSRLPIADEDVVRFPLFNSALWFTYDDGEMIILSSNSEGSLYDDYHRVYGIVIDSNGVPTVYSLYAEKSDPHKNRGIFNQLFILDKDVDNNFWFFDNQNNIHRQFKLVKK